MNHFFTNTVNDSFHKQLLILIMSTSILHIIFEYSGVNKYYANNYYN